jgi:hypothetical protein
VTRINLWVNKNLWAFVFFTFELFFEFQSDLEIPYLSTLSKYSSSAGSLLDASISISYIEFLANYERVPRLLAIVLEILSFTGTMYVVESFFPPSPPPIPPPIPFLSHIKPQDQLLSGGSY